jgi:hypothetical protein
VADLLDAQIGMTALEFDDFGLDRRRHLGPVTAAPSGMWLETGFALLAVNPHPLTQGAEAHAHFAGHLSDGKLFFQTELNCFAPDFIGVGVSVQPAFSPRRPPRGAIPLLLPLTLLGTFHW